MLALDRTLFLRVGLAQRTLGPLRRQLDLEQDLPPVQRHQGEARPPARTRDRRQPPVDRRRRRARALIRLCMFDPSVLCSSLPML